MAFLGQEYQYYIDSKGDIWSSPRKELYYGNIYHGSKEAKVFRASLTGFDDESDSGELGSWFSSLFHQITKKPFTALSHIALAPFTAGASLSPKFFKGLKPAIQAFKTVAPIAATVVAAPFVLPAVGITSAAGAVEAATTAAGVAQSVQKLQQAQQQKKKEEQQAALMEQANQQTAIAQEIQDTVDAGSPITQDLVNRAGKVGIKISPTPGVTKASMMGIGGIPTNYVLGGGAAVVILYLLLSGRK